MDEVEVFPGILISRDFALYLKKEKTIIIADLHLGYEGALHEEGISIPRFQKRAMLKRMSRLIKRYEPETVIVDGDFKHEFSKNLRQEWREVNDVLDFLMENCKVKVIRGNHDNYLKTILSKRNVDLYERLDLGGIVLSHGHKDLTWEGILVMGHEHPSLALRDRVGALLKLPCFLVSPRVIVLPAFTPLALGTDVTSFSFLSPPLRHLDLRDASVYALDEETGILDFSKLEKLRKGIQRSTY